MPTILGGLGEGKELNKPLTDICTPEIWKAHDGIMVVYPQASNYLEDQILKLNVVINIDLGCNMQSWLLASEFLGKCGVF